MNSSTSLHKLPLQRWEYTKQASLDQVENLAQSLDVDVFLATLLVQRGIATFEEAKAFFRPRIQDIHDPFLMQDMDKAAKRLIQAIDKQEKIMVYGDYDVDGTTAVTLVYSFLKKYTEQLIYYVPDRYTEGYGVSERGIITAIEEEVSLIITLDCGIKAHHWIKYAQQNQIDCIICDHHQPSFELPEAFAVLDPKRKDCNYPYKELTGCGVGFKLLQAFCILRKIDEKALMEYLDLIVVSIAADIVPITGENRILAFHGLQKINQNPLPGLVSLKELCGFEKGKDINITQIVFGIAPRINAAGRIKHARKAVELLINGEDNNTTLALDIDQHNKDRRRLDSTITEEVLQMILDQQLEDRYTTVLYNEKWHKGVIGIVASRCIEYYHRPTIIFTQSNGKATGSARSVPGFDIYEAIDKCSHLLEQFGGHQYAAGLTLPIGHLPAFQSAFEKVVANSIDKRLLEPQINIDLKIPLSAVNAKLYRIIKQMAPFGPMNMEPVWVSENVEATQVFLVGKEKKEHLKIKVKQEDSPEFDGIGFFMPQFYERIKSGAHFDLCYHIDVNQFMGKTKLQLRIKDIKFSDD